MICSSVTKSFWFLVQCLCRIITFVKRRSRMCLSNICDCFLYVCNCLIQVEIWIAKKFSGRSPAGVRSSICEDDVEANYQRTEVIKMTMLRDQNSELDKLRIEVQDLELERNNLQKEVTGLQNDYENTKTQRDAHYQAMLVAKSEKENTQRQYAKVEKEKFELFSELRKVTADRDENLRRLSEIMSSRLRDNNPNIADLDDPNRPTKLADTFNELYDNEWTAVFEKLEDAREETEIIALLLDVVMEAHMFCVSLVQKQWQLINQSILWDMQGTGAADTMKWLKDARKSHALSMLPKVEAEFYQFLKQLSLFSEDELKEGDVREYVHGCIRLCWLMAVQDPPVVFECPGWSSKQGQQTGRQSVRQVSTALIKFDRDLFREYTKKGNSIEFIVWPVMYLSKGGSILKKGVAQGCKK